MVSKNKVKKYFENQYCNSWVASFSFFLNIYDNNYFVYSKHYRKWLFRSSKMIPRNLDPIRDVESESPESIPRTWATLILHRRKHLNYQQSWSILMFLEQKYWGRQYKSIYIARSKCYSRRIFFKSSLLSREIHDIRKKLQFYSSVDNHLIAMRKAMTSMTIVWNVTYLSLRYIDIHNDE